LERKSASTEQPARPPLARRAFGFDLKKKKKKKRKWKADAEHRNA
jgi:hypothetical protein